MKQTIYEDYIVEYLLVDKIHTLSSVIDGFFKLFKTINKEDEKRIIKEFFEELNNDDEYITLVNDSNESKPMLKIHGGSFNSILDELKEKEKVWDGFC